MMHNQGNDTEQPFSLSSQNFPKQCKFFPVSQPLSRAERQDIGAAIKARATQMLFSPYKKTQETGRSLMQEGERFCSCGSQFAIWH